MTASGPGKRRKFLVVVDETPEHRVALRFAARRALHTGGIVSLLTVLRIADAQQWKSVQDLLEEEARAEAERVLHDAAEMVLRLTGQLPELVICHGPPREAILALLQDEPDISILVLAAGTSARGPGPLVSAVARDAAQSYPIPVTIVPGGLSDSEVDALA